MASIKNSIDHVFFVAHSARLRGEVDLDAWDDVKDGLVNVLWSGSILDRAGKCLWEEVCLTASILGH